MFKYSADRIPVALILTISLLDFTVFFMVEETWILVCYWFALALPKGLICAWGHHHQHVHTFRHGWLNRPYELLLALHTGASTNLWVLHHNLGHHVNFLDQTKDESAWKRRDGSPMGVLEYTLVIAGTAYARAIRVGRKHPKHFRVFVRWIAVTLVLLLALLWFRPLSALFLFVLPMVVGLLFTSWVTFDHHAGLDTKNSFEASYNILSRPFNLLTGNLGYHTAHHHRQGTHWSKLPMLHEQIRHAIPEHLNVRSTFDVFLRWPEKPTS